MNITIIGTGNVGGALAQRLSEKGHRIFLGVRDINDFKGKQLLAFSTLISVHPIREAVINSEIIILSVPAAYAIDTARNLGDVSGKTIIDTMNAVFQKPGSFSNTTDAILANVNTKDVVKCFNTTGFENILNPIYQNQGIDMFTAGSSEKGIEIASQLSREIGFSNVYHFGGNDTFNLIEQFALAWINLAIIRKQGRNIAFKVVKR